MSRQFRWVQLSLLQLIIGASVQAAPVLGTLEKTYPSLLVSKFLVDPARPYIYASVPSQNSIAIINTNTLTLENMVFIGSGPSGVAMSNDGNRLYVANASSNFVGVLDLNTRTTLPNIQVSETPRDVEVGSDGRLFVLGSDKLMQIDPTTGASAGPNIGPSFMVYSGELAISPTKDRLYYADYGLSPASLYQFDVTVSPPKELWESPHGGTSGSNGQDLEISHDGSFISYPCGAGQIGYSIAKYRTSDMAILGTFNTGAYPREIAFSPNDALAYTVHTEGSIEVWNTHTFLQVGSFHTSYSSSGDMIELMVDPTGQHLFAAYAQGSTSPVYELRVYSTGVPEPASLALLAIAAGAMSNLRRRFRG